MIIRVREVRSDGGSHAKNATGKNSTYWLDSSSRSHAASLFHKGTFVFDLQKSRVHTMNERSSDQQLAERSETQTVVEISQVDQQKAIHKNEYVSRIIGWILRGGVIVSASVILLGLVLMFLHVGEQPNFSMAIGTFPHSLSQVLSGLKVLQPQAVIATGLLLLIATPVVSVTTSLVAFAIERDRRFVVIACVVLAILLTGMLVGKGG